MRQMPILCLELSFTESEEEDGNEKIINLSSQTEKIIDIHGNRDYTLTVKMRRKNHTSNLKAHSPCFLRGKDEGWFLILGDVNQRELWALKRVSGVNGPRRNSQLQFTSPSKSGTFINFLTLFSPISEK